MARLPYQVLVLPFRRLGDAIEYALFKRADAEYWQGIAGGGEGEETPFAAAMREAEEEAAIGPASAFIQLDSMCMLPVVNVAGFRWGADVLVIPEYTFGVEVIDAELSISNEHTEYAWLGYEEALSRLHWESNRTALWELHHRLTLQR